MEDTVIRSQSGSSGRSAALASSRTTHRSKQVTTACYSRKPKRTPDYLTSLLSSESSVDSSPGSFFPVLHGLAAAVILVRKYFRRGADVRDVESLFRDGRSMHAAFPGLRRKEKRGLAPATPRAAAVLLGGCGYLLPLLPAAYVARLLFFHDAPGPRAPGL